MKWPKTKQTANAGVLFVETVVNEHGSIFHPIHQENDIGIDGLIELIDVGEGSGQLVAVQIKSGDSYLATDGKGFRIPVDQSHIDYWLSYMVPVVIVGYSPTQKKASWTSVRDYVEHNEYHERGKISSLELPEYRSFDVDAIKKGIAGLAHTRSDERLLFKCADSCFSSDPQRRRDGFNILQAHPDSCGLRLTADLAKRFIMDDDVETAKDALFILGYGVGRQKWSWNPNNKNEQETIGFVSDLCSDLKADEIKRLVELCDEGPFNGPTGMGERCLDVISCCIDTAESVLDDILRVTSNPIERRANALLMLNWGDWDELIEHSEFLMDDDKIKDVMIWIFGSEDEIKRQKSEMAT